VPSRSWADVVPLAACPGQPMRPGLGQRRRRSRHRGPRNPLAARPGSVRCVPGSSRPPSIQYARVRKHVRGWAEAELEPASLCQVAASGASTGPPGGRAQKGCAQAARPAVATPSTRPACCACARNARRPGRSAASVGRRGKCERPRR
jgi:hypothetical protein